MINVRSILFAAAVLPAVVGCVEDGAGDGADAGVDDDDVVAVAFETGRIERVSKTSESSSTWWRNVTATCDVGRSVYAMGSKQYPDDNILFRGVLPTGDGERPTGAKAAAHEDYTGYRSNWTMTAYAICGPAYQGPHLYTSQSALSSSFRQTHEVTCPAGERVVGGGGTILNGDGRVKIDEIRPSPSLDRITVVGSEDDWGTSESWRVVASALCADPPPGLELVTASTELWGNGVTAACPAGKRLIGLGGGGRVDLAERMRLHELVPSSDLRSVRVRGDNHGSPGTLSAYAICADE